MLMYPQCISAQLFYNNGAEIQVNDGGLVIVKTNWLQNQSGIINNAGTIIVEGDLLNAADANGNGVATGLYEVQGDWINNGTFTADQSEVLLSGDNQFITGTSESDFFNLTLRGTGIKTMTLNSMTLGVLDLGDVELATDDFVMMVVDPNPAAIVRGDGFVSSLGDGNLSRAMNSTSTYLFPTGSSLGTFRYRPVEITPSSAADHTYGVRLANVLSTTEGFDNELFDPEEICAVNPNFYHRIHRTAGADAADLRFFFDKAADGDWNLGAHWEGTPWWANATPSSETIANGFDVIDVSAWNNFDPRPFALAAGTPELDVTPADQSINPGEVASFTTTYTGTSLSDVVWTPPTDLTCTTCLEPMASPAQDTEYIITVIDVNGCSVSDSALVRVMGEQLAIPTAFSPNGDTENDLFGVLNTNFESMTMRIYNRWGEFITTLTAPDQKWDGTLDGEPQEMGVYVYHIEYQLTGEQPAEHRGDVTLVR